MKKITTVVILFIIFLIIYFLQSNFFTWFNIDGIKPNLFIVLIVFIGLFAGRNISIIFGAVIGVFLDIFIGEIFGISVIMYALLGLLSGYFNNNFSKESRITIMLMIMGATFVFEFGMYIIGAIILKTDIEWIQFAKIGLIEVLFNTILIIILYPLLRFSGYQVEKIFKGEKKLTRYF